VEDKIILLLIGLVLLTSGCLEEIGLENDEELPNRGLVIEDFSVSDSELRPNQQAVVTAYIRNYHRDIDLETVELANVGTLLNAESEGCSPEASELEGARDGVQPTMTCTWTVEAPGEDALEGFTERNEPVQLRLEYSASMENEQPLRVEFRPVDEITSTEIVSESSSNGEVSMRLSSDSPVTMEAGTSLEVVADNAGPGRIPDGYSFNFEPRDLFTSGCEDGKTEEPLTGDEVNFVCSLESDNQGTDNVFVSLDYKYIKEPVLDITIVNR